MMLVKNGIRCDEPGLQSRVRKDSTAAVQHFDAPIVNCKSYTAFQFQIRSR